MSGDWRDMITQGVVCGEVQGGTGATQMPNVPVKLVRFTAMASNGGNVYVGGPGVTRPNGSTDTTTGLELEPGDDTGWIPLVNLNQFYYICDNATDDFSYLGLL